MLSKDLVRVKATVTEHSRAAKVIVFKKKRRKNYKRKKGMCATLYYYNNDVSLGKTLYRKYFLCVFTHGNYNKKLIQ